MFKMADMYAGIRADKQKAKLSLSSIIWEPKTPLSYKSDSLACKFLKACVKMVSSYAKDSFTGKDAFHLLSKISLMMLLRSNPILSVVMPVGSIVTSSLAFPAVTKILSVSGVFDKAENELVKHQLTGFIQMHSCTLSHLQSRMDSMLENIQKAFDKWLSNEDEDEEPILRECLRIEIENFESTALVRPLDDEYIMKELDDGWTQIDLKPS
jgi:transcriptional regulator of heat shock response